jgi:hypothetical protein
MHLCAHGLLDHGAYCIRKFVERVYVHLLTSKAWVAPLKPTSIPRLELMSARLLAQLVNSVKGALRTQVKVHVDYTCFWLDSTTVLYWIRNRGEWKQFVHYRVMKF